MRKINPEYRPLQTEEYSDNSNSYPSEFTDARKKKKKKSKKKSMKKPSTSRWSY